MIDRSMNRAEYMHWRKIARYMRAYAPPHYGDMNNMPTDRAELREYGKRLGRQMAIHIRVERNKVRMGLP